MGKIYVEGAKIYAYHGCFKEETLIGTNFIVDIELDVDLTAVSKSDSLADTVNYQTVFQLVNKEMQTPSKLLEHVADRCITALFNEFETINKINFKVSKLNPPLGGHIDAVSVRLIREKQ
jgi:dihydroneopterin aldolase